MNKGKTVEKTNLPKKVNSELGKVIQQARENKNLTQKQLASILDIPEKTMSGMETGRRPPNAIMKRKLCKALEVSNLLDGLGFDLALLNIIQETLCMFTLSNNELHFIIEELKIRFGFDILGLPVIEDEMFEKNRKKLKSISEERQIYILDVIKNILEAIYSLYKIGEKNRLFFNFSYYLINFYKRDFKNIIKFPTEYCTMLNIDYSDNIYYTQLKNGKERLEHLKVEFEHYAQNKYFHNDKVYRFDYENNKEIFYKIRGKINGYYSYGENYEMHIKEQIKEYAKNRKETYNLYNNSFLEYGTVKEFQLQMLEILNRLDKNYILNNNPIPIHILPRYNVIDGYENLEIKLASDEYEYIAVKIGRQLSYRYSFYNESDVITVQLEGNYSVGDDIFIWDKRRGFDIGRVIDFNENEVSIRNDLGKHKYILEDLRNIGIIANVNKIYYKNIEKNLKS